jgi:uridine kinase
MKKLILVAGPPACGKTYVSNLISKNLGNITYLDKDDLAPLVRRTFKLNNENFDMDGEFYSSNVRDVEYETLINIALSSLSYSDIVLINAPLSQEVRDIDYMKSLKSKAQLKGAKLIVI